jgi:hypothetical protein
MHLVEGFYDRNGHMLFKSSAGGRVANLENPESLEFS